MEETLEETIGKIPDEAWPLIDLLTNLTVASVALWAAVTAFVLFRREASNLTPVHATKKNKKAQPDFLKVDKKKRKEALAKGRGFEKDLLKREKNESKAAEYARRAGQSAGQRIAGLISFVMSFFTLATMIYGAIFQVSRMGKMMQEYSTLERITAVIQAHPIAFVIASLVIIFHIYRFITGRKWQQEL